MPWNATVLQGNDQLPSSLWGQAASLHDWRHPPLPRFAVACARLCPHKQSNACDAPSP